MVKMGDERMTDVQEMFPGIGPETRPPSAHEVRSGLAIGDEVRFDYHGEQLAGQVVKFNPKRAKVQVNGGSAWSVPYSALVSNNSSTPKVVQSREKYHYCRRVARGLMDAYGLKHWTFTFDEAGRYGQCNYGKKQITLTYSHVERSDSWEVIKTILHEIAHALADKEIRERDGWRETGHGPTWQRIAERIGGV